MVTADNIHSTKPKASKGLKTLFKVSFLMTEAELPLRSSSLEDARSNPNKESKSNLSKFYVHSVCSFRDPFPEKECIGNPVVGHRDFEQVF